MPTPLRPPRRAVALAALLALLPAPAQGATLHEQVSEASAEVEVALDVYRRATRAETAGLAELVAATGDAERAEVTGAEAAETARLARARQAAQVRAVYAGDGPAGLLVSVLDADSPDDLLWRAGTARRVVSGLLAGSAGEAERAGTEVALAADRQVRTDAAVDEQVAALNRLRERTDVAEEALHDARAALGRLTRQARRLAAARRAARAIEDAQDAARRARIAALGPVTALGIPVEYEIAYRAAARTCPGLRWTLLAGVGQVESGHGRNTGPSSAGAIGPMQFMPRTFAAYGVDGDGDGVKNAWDPQDAIFGAARYLCVSGARGGSAGGVHRALLAYNHAEWYVDLVLAAELAIVRAGAR